MTDEAEDPIDGAAEARGVEERLEECPERVYDR
jgi:hypothetical protein